jgi:uncharacterized protein DUF3147
MRIKFDFSVLTETKWYEYAVRFLFGGAVTVLTGLLAKRFGPVFGGLFLAFPAIFPASATLVEKHERQKKLKAGIPETARGRKAAALDARGASLGTLGLACFGLTVWKLLPSWNSALVLFAALVIWLGVSILAWQVRRRYRLRPKPH